MYSYEIHVSYEYMLQFFWILQLRLTNVVFGWDLIAYFDDRPPSLVLLCLRSDREYFATNGETLDPNKIPEMIRGG